LALALTLFQQRFDIRATPENPKYNHVVIRHGKCNTGLAAVAYHSQPWTDVITDSAALREMFQLATSEVETIDKVTRHGLTGDRQQGLENLSKVPNGFGREANVATPHSRDAFRTAASM
jgi:hypothetical protein